MAEKKPMTYHQTINNPPPVGTRLTSEQQGKFGKDSKGKPVEATVTAVKGTDVTIKKDR